MSNKEEVKGKNDLFRYYILVLLFVLGILAVVTINNYIETLRYIGLTPQERQKIDEQTKLKQLEDDKKSKENWDNLFKSMSKPISVPAFIVYAMGFIVVYFFFALFTKTRRFL
jgi:uncharacterized membrane protein